MTPDAGSVRAAQPSGRARGPKRRRPLVGRSLSGFLLLVVLVGLPAQFVTLPFVILRPGPAVDVLGAPGSPPSPVIRITGAKTYPTDGALFFTTVAQYGGPDRRPTAWDVLAALLQPDTELLRESVVYPPQVSEQDVRKENSAAMTDSQHEAVAVALRKVGARVTEQAVVAQALPDGPATGVLAAGDVITQVDGVRVTRAPQVSEQIQRSGGAVRLGIRRGGVMRTLSLTPVRRGGRKVIGVLVQPTFDFGGVRATISAGDVGGPSAGMMFALGVYDTLTPGGLTAGRRIAGTGTIDSEGDVGVIGGIAQKMVGARQSGAGYFLAPRGNCAEVVGHVPSGLVVTPVDDFDQAVHAVQEIAAGRASTLPSCPSA